jgi:hypothetical protein
VHTTLFLGVILVAPPPFPPVDAEAMAVPYPYDERMMVVITTAAWERVPEMYEVRIGWNLDSPPGVFLVDCTLQSVALRLFWSGPSQRPGLRVFPFRSHFQGELREVWFRDAYGRILKKIPVRSLFPH